MLEKKSGLNGRFFLDFFTHSGIITGMKKIILCDIDGVLADFVGGLSDLHSFFDKKDIYHYDIHVSLKQHPKYTGKEFWSLTKSSVITSNFCLNLKAYDGSEQFIKSLKELCIERNYDLFFVTKPFGVPGWVDQRNQWMEEKFEISEKQIIHAHTKDFIDGDFFIEDSLSNVEAWMKHETNRKKNFYIVPSHYNTSCSHYDVNCSSFKTSSIEPNAMVYADILKTIKEKLK